jgi:hypothetical protein
MAYNPINPDCISMSGLIGSQKMFLANPHTTFMNYITLYSQSLPRDLSNLVRGLTRSCRRIQTAALSKSQSAPYLSMVFCLSALSITLYFIRRMPTKSCNDDTGPHARLSLILLGIPQGLRDLPTICPRSFTPNTVL